MGRGPARRVALVRGQRIVTIALFILGLVVAALGIPGVWDWATTAPMRFLSFMAGASEPPHPADALATGGCQHVLDSVNRCPSCPARLASSGPDRAHWANVLALRASAPKVPTLAQLREHVLDDIEDAIVPPGPSPRCSGCGRPGPECRVDPCWGLGRNGGGGRGGDVGGGRERPGKIGPGRQDPPAPPPRARLW